MIDTNDPLARAVVEAIHAGDLPTLKRLLADNPRLATARLSDDNPNAMSRTLLHVATDWPGHFPSVAATITILNRLAEWLRGRGAKSASELG